jgi:hypothetical protein
MRRAASWRRAGIPLLLLLLGCGPAPGAAASQELETIPALLALLRFDTPPDFCGEPVPLDDPDVRERLEKELLLMAWDRPQVILWLKRGSRIMPHIETILRREGLPEDLKYLAVAESALRADIGSPKGAMGYWQFIKPTGQRYGLAVDTETDERRELLKATLAAARYLKDLHGLFGSWTLAAAAYNMGEEGLKNEIALQELQDFYRLYLPQETQRYLLRIVAAKLILSRPERFGFHLRPEDLYPPLAFDRLTLTLPRPTPLMLIAKAAGTDYKAIRDLNPQIRSRELPAGPHELNQPPGTAAGFHQRLDPLLPLPAPPPAEAIHVVRPGDSLSAIAARYGLSLSELQRRNRLPAGHTLKPGERLRVGAAAQAGEEGR